MGGKEDAPFGGENIEGEGDMAGGFVHACN